MRPLLEPVRHGRGRVRVLRAETERRRPEIPLQQGEGPRLLLPRPSRHQLLLRLVLPRRNRCGIPKVRSQGRPGARPQQPVRLPLRVQLRLPLLPELLPQELPRPRTPAGGGHRPQGRGEPPDLVHLLLRRLPRAPAPLRHRDLREGPGGGARPFASAGSGTAAATPTSSGGPRRSP